MFQGGIFMKCGAKRYLVEIEVDGEKQIKSALARTSAEARKNIRKKYGAETHILVVREEKRAN